MSFEAAMAVVLEADLHRSYGFPESTLRWIVRGWRCLFWSGAMPILEICAIFVPTTKLWSSSGWIRIAVVLLNNGQPSLSELAGL